VGAYKKRKPQQPPLSLQDEFGKVYAQALYDASAKRSFHDDSGCYYDMLQKEVTHFDKWKRMYQPTQSMKQYENGIFFYIFQYNEPITEEQFASFQPIIKKVKKRYLESYNDVLKHTGNKWSSVVTNATFKQIAQIEKDLYLDKGVIKFSLTIRGYHNWTCHDYWVPVRLLCWATDQDPDDYIVDEQTLERYRSFTHDAVPAQV
jgi:hypothetical protein